MISFSTKADKNGFWYLINVSEDCAYTLNYIVVGSGGRQTSGEISGIAASKENWQFQQIGFPVLRVGITDLQIEEKLPAVLKSSSPQPNVEKLSRRRAIRNFASAFLAGGAMLMFPSGSSSQVVPSQTASTEEIGELTGSFNPYGNDRADSFNPYS